MSTSRNRLFADQSFDKFRANRGPGYTGSGMRNISNLLQVLHLFPRLFDQYLHVHCRPGGFSIL